MPSIEAAGTSPASPEHVDRLQFKSHKSLPRRTHASSDDQIAKISPRSQNGHPSDGVPRTTAPILPLTPPGITQDESPTGTGMRKAATSSQSVVAAFTPSKPSHPPTPETTPPRSIASNRPGLNQFGYISTSSRAESFQTACEMISDGETETPRPSPPSLSRSASQRKVRRNEGSRRSDTRTRETTPATERSPAKGFANGREERFPTTAGGRQEPSNLEIKLTRDAAKRVGDVTDGSVSNVETPTRGRRSLRARLTQVKPLDDVSAMDQFRQQIGWPSQDDQLGLSEPEDIRRFSGVSASSTVEAMIIDTPKPARRALRHTEKRLSLRSTSSPITRSEHTSIASSSDSQHRLTHKSARITENDRRSIASEISMSGCSTLGALQQPVDVVPVIVIPQRRSSLKARSDSASRNPSKSRSRPASQHAPTLPKSRSGSLDLPRQRKRTCSDPHASSAPTAGIRGRLLTRPYIPPRSSSLSAPTSQNNSRTTSLTSESLRSHNLAVESEMKRQPPEQPQPALVSEPCGQDRHDTAEHSKTQSILIGVEDLSHLRPPSVPFTQYSIPSSSPGPFEINEARTVTIFPHNNESLLLVDPQIESGLRGPPPPVDQPRTPEIAQERDAPADSPLRNPRPPPPPPISTAVHPGTECISGQPPKEGEGDTDPTVDPGHRAGYKRRGWISRPRSDSFNSFVRNFSLSTAKNPKAGEDIDGRLQPFWRPRRFWDDSPEGETAPPEEERGGSGAQSTEPPDQIISNSLGMPHKRIVFEGPAIASHRQGPKRRIDGYRRANRDTLVGNRIFSPEALYSQTSLHQREFPAVSWWRLRFRSGTVRSLRMRLRRSMQRRAEGRREARREKLKQSIGEAVLVNSSTQVKTIQ